MTEGIRGEEEGGGETGKQKKTEKFEKKVQIPTPVHPGGCRALEKKKFVR